MHNREGLNFEVSVGVTFASFMSAVTLFFTGILIAQFHSFDSTIKIPLLFLIISTFSFIFSASIYSNAGIEITNNNPGVVHKYLIYVYANNIFEFLGTYLFIFATPLVIGAVTKDHFFRIATIIIALSGLALYSQSSFSILHKELSGRGIKALFTFIIVALGLGMYLAQEASKNGQLSLYNTIATILLIVIGFSTTLFCIRSKQYLLDK